MFRSVRERANASPAVIPTRAAVRILVALLLLLYFAAKYQLSLRPLFLRPAQESRAGRARRQTRDIIRIWQFCRR
jgi:hypothetical protein